MLPELQCYIGLDRAPDILVLNAGGNDLGVWSSRKLMRDTKLDLLWLWSSYPGIMKILSDMVARRFWRQARSIQGITKARS